MNTIVTATDNNFYLKVSLPNLVERLSKEKSKRPLIKNTSDDDLQEFIGKHLFERSFYYNQSKNVITCDGKSPQIIVDEIKAKLI